MDPSELNAGEPSTKYPVTNVHNTAPEDPENAYTFRSKEPTNTRPVTASTAGDDDTAPPQVNDHDTLPVEVSMP